MKAYRLIALILFLVLLLAITRNVISTQAATPTLAFRAPPTAANTNVFDVQIVVSNSVNLAGFEFDLAYDHSLVQVVGISLTNFLGQASNCNPSSTRCAVALGPKDQMVGTTKLGAYTFGAGGAPSGDGVLGTLRLKPLGQTGTLNITMNNPVLSDASGHATTPRVQSALITLVPSFNLYLPLIER